MPPIFYPIEHRRTPAQKSHMESGRYMVIRKDGKIHFESFNGSGFAYNDKDIQYFYIPKIN